MRSLRLDWASVENILKQGGEDESVKKVDVLCDTDLDVDQGCFVHRVLLWAWEVVVAYKDLSEGEEFLCSNRIKVLC